MGIVARQSIKGTVATYIGVAVGIVTTFFIQTKALEPDQIGLIDVLLQCSILFAGLSQLGTSSSAMRYYPFFKDKETHDHGFFGWTLLVPLVGFALFIALFFSFKSTIVEFFSSDSSLFSDYVDAVVPLAFFMLYITVFETNSNLLLRIVLPKFVREVGLRVATLVVYLLYYYNFIDFDGVILGFCLFYGLATLINIIYLLSLKRVSFRIDRGFVNRELRRDFLYYTLFMVAAAIAGTAIPMLSKFLLAGMQGFYLAGVFTIATNIAALVEMPYRSLGAISRPHVSEAMAHRDFAKANALCKTVSLHQFIVGLFVLFLIWINIDFLFDLLPNGDIYRMGKWAVLILAIGRLVYSTLDVSLTALSYSKYYYYSLGFTLFLAVLSVLLNRWLIPRYDINGAAMAYTLSYLAYFILLLAFIKWKVGVLVLSWKQLVVAAIVGMLFALNALWTTWLTPWLKGWFDHALLGLTADAILKSMLFVLIGLTALYMTKVSPSVNDLLNKVLHVFRRQDQ